MIYYVDSRLATRVDERHVLNDDSRSVPTPPVFPDSLQLDQGRLVRSRLRALEQVRGFDLE